MKEVAGKVAFITCGANGIGLGITQAMGLQLALVDVDAAALDTADAERRAQGANVLALRTGVTGSRRRIYENEEET